MKSKLIFGLTVAFVIVVFYFFKNSPTVISTQKLVLKEQNNFAKKNDATSIISSSKTNELAQKKAEGEKSEKIFEDESDDDKDKYDGPAAAAKFDYDRMIDHALGRVPQERLLTALDQTILNRNAVSGNNYRQTQGQQQTQQASASLPLLPALNWTERGSNSDAVGPSNGNSRANNGITSGRIRAIWVDYNDPTNKTVFIGGVDGGLWQTTDVTASPATWNLVNDYLSNLAISAICQDPRPGFTNILYFCTGESYYNVDAVQGNGVFKSIDGGVTWNYLSSTSSFTSCTRILCDYLGNVYLATRGTGLRRSTNGGATWSANLTPSGLPSDICDMEISSTTAAGRLHIVTGIFSTQGYRYTDVPTTVSSTTGWNSPTTAFPSYSMRAEIACSNQGAGLASACTLYALPSNASYQVPTIYKSTDGGANWATCTSTGLSSTWASGQGWYALSIDINPSDPTQAIIGGLDTWKTTNSGSNWSQISTWVGTTPVNQYVHADVHKILWFDSGNKILFSSDGGLFYSSNGGSTIRDRNAGLRIKQFYSCAIHPSTTNYFLAGAQDNGVHQFSSAGLSSSVEVTGGDGAFVEIDQNQPQYQFGSYVYNQYRVSTNSGVNWSSANLNANTGQFINPIDYDNTNKIMYCSEASGSYRRWTNPQTGSTSAAVSISNLSGSVTSVTVSPYTSNRVYFGTSNGKVVQVDNANTIPSGSAGTDRSTGLPSGNTVSCINEGTSDNNLIAVFSNYGINNIWVSTNGGTSWTGCDGNLPDMPVRWAMFFPNDNNKAYIATETGVWQTDNLNGASTVWSSNSTFPTVRTDMIKYRTSDRTIAAATHGRGLFTATVPLLCDIVVNTPTISQPTCVAPSGTILNSATSVNTLEYSIDNGATWQSGASFSGLIAGSYNIQVRLQGEPTCYASYANNSVTINAAPFITPAVSISSSANNVCSGTSVTITATPTNGGSSPTYNFKVNGNSVQNNSSNTYTTTGFTNGQSVSCVMTSSDVCANPTTATSTAITMNVATNVMPSVAVAASTNNICTGTSVIITATPTNGGGAPTYNFKVNGNSVQNSSNAAYTTTSFNNNDAITCVMTANNTCQTASNATSGALTIVVKPNSTKTISASICAGSSYTVGTSSYSTNGTFVTHLTNYLGCDSVVTLNLTVASSLTPSVFLSPSANNICIGTNVIITATPNNGGSAPIYDFSVNGTSVQNNTNNTYTSSSFANNDAITCVMTANNSCQTASTAISNAVTMLVNVCGGSSLPNDNPCGSISGSANTGYVNSATPNLILAYDNGSSAYGGIADNPTGISGSSVGLPPSGPNLIYWTGTTVSASSYSSEPMPPGVTNPGGNTQKSIWYKFHAPTMADATVYLSANFQASTTWNNSTHSSNWILAAYKLTGGSACSSPTFAPLLSSGNVVYNTSGYLQISGTDLATQGLLGADIYVQLMLPSGNSGSYLLSLQGIMPDIGPGATNQFTTTSLPIAFTSPLNNVNLTYLYWRPVGGTGYGYTQINGSPSTYTVQGLNSGVNYNFWALYVNANGSRFYSRVTSPIGTITGCSGIQQKPTVTHVTSPAVHCSKVNVNWTCSVAAGDIPASYPFRIYWLKTGASGYGVAAVQSLGTGSPQIQMGTYQISGLALGQSYDYYYRVLCIGGAQVVSNVTRDTTCSGPNRLSNPTKEHTVYEVNGTYFVDADIREVIAAYEAAHPETQVNDGQEHYYNLHQVDMPNITDELPSTATSSQGNLVENTGSFSLIPNPTSNRVKVSYSLPSEHQVEATINLLDMSGRVLHSIKVAHPNQEGWLSIDLSDINSGVYLINVQTAGYIETQKLVVK